MLEDADGEGANNGASDVLEALAGGGDGGDFDGGIREESYGNNGLVELRATTREGLVRRRKRNPATAMERRLTRKVAPSFSA